MFSISIAFLLLGLLLLILWFIPKGNLIHEGIRIPHYNWRLRTKAIKNVTVEKITFGAHRRQYLLYIEPDQPSINKNEVIVYYHGGGWMFGNPKAFILNATFFTRLGYTVIMPCYRCLPFYRFKTIREDLNLALQKTLTLMQEKNSSHKKIILGGMSAGANLAALIAYDQPSLKQMGCPQNKFSRLMLFGGPLNLHEMAPTPILWGYAGWQSNQTFNQASPIHHLQKDQVPFEVIIIHGKKDGLVNFRNATTFVEKLQTIQKRGITFYTLPTGTHLDAGKWVFDEMPAKEWIENWLDETILN